MDSEIQCWAFDNHIHFSPCRDHFLHYPQKYIQNNIGKCGLLVSFAIIYLLIFLNTRYYPYYLIPIYTFSILGCISVATFLQSKNIRLSAITYCIIVMLMVTLGAFTDQKIITELKYWKQPSPYEKIAAMIKQDDTHPTLMLLGIQDGVTYGTCLYTKLNIIPNVKYCYYPNISRKEYPEIYNAQMKNVREGICKYLVVTGEQDWDKNHSTFNINDQKEITDYYDLIANYELDQKGCTIHLFKLRNSNQNHIAY